MRHLTIFLCAVLVVFGLNQAQGRIIHVPADSSTIQGGIDGANYGDTVLVEQDTYHENVMISGKNVVLASWYIITGDTSFISSTVIDGSAAGHCIVINFSAGKIEGFTLTNGYTTAGGGIFIFQSPSAPGDYLIVENNRIVDNPACGIFAMYSKAFVTNNIFMNNYDDYSGGGIYSYHYDSTVILGNLFVGNSAPGGGAIGCQDNARPLIKNNTIYGNVATSNYAGGIDYTTDSYPEVINNIIVLNSGGGISSGSPGEDYLFCNDVWGNFDGEDYIGCDPGTGDISCDPWLCCPAADYYYLAENSCCVGAGCDSFGNPDSSINIGAFGIGCPPFLPPDSFSLLSPLNKAFTPRVVRFDWETATVPNPCDPIRYDLYLSTSFPVDTTTPADSNLVLSEHVKTLDYGAYYWMVRAKDDHGLYRWCNQARYFMVTGIHHSSGDLNGDGSIDIGDVVFSVNYLYMSGPAPDPLELGDVNCDAKVDLADAVYLVNYLFIGGPPPCEPR